MAESKVSIRPVPGMLRAWWHDYTRLVRLTRSHMRSYVIGQAGASLTGSAQEIMMAFVFKDLMTAATTGNLSYVIRAATLVGVAAAVLCILNPLFVYLQYRSIATTLGYLKGMMFRRVCRLPMSYFEKSHSGDVLQRMAGVEDVARAYQGQLDLVFQAVFLGGGSIIAMLALNWRLGLILLALGIAATLVNTAFAAPLRAAADEERKRSATLIEYLVDLVNNIPVIRMFHMEKRVWSTIDHANNRLCAVARTGGIWNAIMIGVSVVLYNMNFIGVIAFGAFLVVRHITDFPTLVALAQLHRNLNGVLLSAGEYLPSVQNSLASASRVFTLLDTSDEAPPPAGPEVRPVPSTDAQRERTIVDLQDVTFSYDEKTPVLKGATLCVQEGEVAALVGPSGGGKSTIVKLLMGFYYSQHGVVRVGERRVQEYLPDELRSLTGYVPQDPHIFTGTLEDNLRCGRMAANRDEVEAAARASFAHQFIEKLPHGYQTMAGERGCTLSGGQKQRIAIARALLKDAPILLLDEATSSLDSESEELVQQALLTLMRGRTTVAISHRLSTIRHADRIYVIDKGEVVESGTHDRLFEAHGLYRRLFDLQFAV
jgi:ABC-type multidrug transport system fused ATPase/permease subunit